MNAPTPPAGWYPDPRSAAGSNTMRWWDGDEWTDQTRVQESTPPPPQSAPQQPSTQQSAPQQPAQQQPEQQQWAPPPPGADTDQATQQLSTPPPPGPGSAPGLGQPTPASPLGSANAVPPPPSSPGLPPPPQTYGGQIPGTQPPSGPQKSLDGLIGELTGPGRTTHQTMLCIMAVGLVFVVLGSILPWATVDFGFGSESVAGIQAGGGVTTFLLGIFGLAGPILALMGRAMAVIGGLVAAGLALLIALFNISDISSFGDFGIGVSVGFGLWIVLLGALAAGGTGIAALVNKPSPAAPA